jgi:hypothetical protein
LAAMEPIAPGREASFLLSGVSATMPVKVYIAGRRADVVSITSGPAPGFIQVRIRAGPAVLTGPRVALSVAAGNSFTCLVEAPVAARE